MEKIKVLFVGVGQDPKVMEIENTLEAKQELVGGYIEMVTPVWRDFGETAVIICNEEGKLLRLKPNAYLLTDEVFGIPYDVICGDFLIVDAPEDSEDFGSLSDEQIAKFSEWYKAEDRLWGDLR